ncbi:MAG: transglutaminase-like domain-containing protein [Treponema sp.]|nr:transglutaminase-like domain-containing protein [Treponema sp.]
MKHTKILPVLAVILLLFPGVLGAAQYYSAAWGFYIDLPPDYKYSEGDGASRFNYKTSGGASLDMVVYPANAAYKSVKDLAADVKRRINSSGDIDYFEYADKDAAILELIFPDPTNAANTLYGWGLALQLDSKDTGGDSPLLIALAYSPVQSRDIQLLHLSVLDSIAPSESDRLIPGPVSEYSYPRTNGIRASVYGLGKQAWFYAEDADAGQALIDREFNVLTRYADTAVWEDAWSRYYRMIYRDSYDRLSDAALVIEKELRTPGMNDRDFAVRVLEWVQQFTYERDFNGSDFTNLTAAVIDGRGDCDSRAMLWALILNHAGIKSAIMVSREYSHAMGLADLEGSGARFDFAGIQWLTAETTAQVSLGLIGSDISDPQYWLGILLQ